VLQAGPVILHRMQEASGATIADSNGVMTMTLQGVENTRWARNQTSPLSTGEPADRATSFIPDGATASTAIATGTLPALPTNQLTIEGWAKVTTLGSAVYLFSNSNGGINGSTFYVDVQTSGELRVRFGNVTVTTASAGITANTWFHFAVVLDGGPRTGQVFINGVSRGSGTGAFSVSTIIKTWRYGNHTAAANPAITWYLDEVAYYDYPLDGDEILRHYNARDVTVRADPILVNLSPWVRDEITWSRGRKTWLSLPDAGKAQFTLDNRDRRFEVGYQGALANLMPNPSLETNATGWTNNLNSTLARSTAQSFVGQASVLHTVTATSASQISSPTLPTITVSPSTAYTLSGYVRPGTLAGTAKIVLTWWTSGTVFISQVDSASVTPGAGAWTRLTATGTSPSNAAFAQAFLVLNGPTAGNTVYWDAIQLEPGSAVSDYIDGSLPDGRWSGTSHNSTSYRGGPYHGQLKPRRKIRVRAVYPPNLVTNGSFEDGDLTGWTATTGTTAVNSHATAYYHRRGVRGKGTGSTGYRAYSDPANAQLNVLLTSDLIPVDPSRPHTLTGAFTTWSGSTAQSTIRLECYDKEQRLLGFVWPNTAPSNATAAQVTHATGHFNPPGTWQRYGGTYTGQTGVSNTATGGFIPGTAFVRVTIYLHFNNATVGVIVDAVELRESTEASLTTNVDEGYDEGTWYDLTTVYAEDWLPEERSPTDNVVSVPCVDGLGLLAGQSLSAKYLPQQTVENRIGSLLNIASWPEDQRALDTATNTVAEVSLPEGENLAEHMVKVGVFDWGLFFMDAAGNAVFQAATWKATNPRSTASQATLLEYDNNTAWPYEEIEWETGTQAILNVGKGQRPGGVQQIYEDMASIEEYGRREYTEEMYATVDSTVLTRITDIIANYNAPRARVRSVTVNPETPQLWTIRTAMWPIFLRTTLQDRFQVQRTPQGVGTARTWNTFVQGVEYSIDLNNGRWRARWYLPDIAGYSS
jgi:hypothetical protein